MKTKLFLTLIVAALAFSSCQKDSDIFIPLTTSGADSIWVSAITDASLVSTLKKSLNKETTVDSVDATAGGTIITKDGLTIIIAPQSLVLSTGVLASGKIYAETMLIKQRGDMILTDRPTTSNGRILINGAEIFIRLRKESDELYLASGKTVYVRYSDAQPVFTNEDLSRG